MLRSLYSGVSGMKVNQVKMDVIGNNIANVGTTAFKEGRTRFQDMLSQNTKDAMSPMPNTGGVNPSQVGLGVQLAGIDTLTSQGMMQPTGNNLDVAIDGDGYFMVGKGPIELSASAPKIKVDQTAGKHVVTQNPIMDVSYTRDGSFTLDSGGNLLTSDGYRVLGYSFAGTPDQVAPTAQSTGGLSFALGTGGALNGYSIIIGDITNAVPAPTATIDTAAKTIKLEGDVTAAGGVLTSTLQTDLNAKLAAAGIKQTISLSGQLTSAGNPSVISGGAGNATGPTTNPMSYCTGTLSAYFGAGAALNGYNITIVDAVQPAPTVSIAGTTITLTGNLTGAGGAAIPASGFQSLLNNALSAKGIDQTITLSGSVTAGDNAATALSGGTDDSIVHSLDGTAAAPIVNYVNAAKPLAADDGNLKTLMIPDKVLISGTAGAPDAVYSKVKTFSISKEGLITAVLDSGKVAVLGQIATASFKNPAGLTKDGKNLYSGSSNSGDPTLRSGVGTAATNEDNSAGYGDISQGMLEMSNVDLAQQFTDMIVTSRAFQASGKMITTGDEMLQDIINLKR